MVGGIIGNKQNQWCTTSLNGVWPHMCHLMENTIWCTMIPWCSGCHMFTPYAYLDTEAACTTGRLLFNTNPSTSALHLEGDDFLLLPLTKKWMYCALPSIIKPENHPMMKTQRPAMEGLPAFWEYRDCLHRWCGSSNLSGSSPLPTCISLLSLRTSPNQLACLLQDRRLRSPLPLNLFQ